MSFRTAEDEKSPVLSRNTALKENEHTNPRENVCVCVCDGVEKAHVWWVCSVCRHCPPLSRSPSSCMWTVYCRTESHQGSCHCRGKTRQQWISNNVSPFCPLPNWRHPQCLSQIWTNKMRISCNQLLLLFSCVWGLTMGAFPSSVQIGKYGGSSQKHELHVKCVKLCQLNEKNMTVCIGVNCECQCANNAVGSRFCCMTAKGNFGRK